LNRQVFITVFLIVFKVTVVRADWPMPGHDPQRTSWAQEDEGPPADKLRWLTKIGPYIPSAAHLITVAGQESSEDMLYVPAASGIIALDPLDGAQKWQSQLRTEDMG